MSRRERYLVFVLPCRGHHHSSSLVEIRLEAAGTAADGKPKHDPKRVTSRRVRR